MKGSSFFTARARVLALSLLTTTASGLLFGNSFGVPGVETEYDYIIVGGGCAGLTVAARLAEDASVAVIEAGSFYEISNGNISQIPADDVYYIGKDVDNWQPGVDWGFITVPQEGGLNVTAHYARGKTFGGSTARNIMTYHPGTRGSYDQWAEIVGDDSYSYDNIWQYFMKHQNFTEPDMQKRFANTTVNYNISRLGQDGPVHVIYPNYAAGFGTWAALGMNDVGISPIDGFESGELIGSAYALATIDYDLNTRISSETAYLQTSIASGTGNLIAYPSTMGKRILFDDSNRATGVTVETMGLTYNLNARREVILSAGAFQSPQLLMVSGIGPEEKLAPHNIPVRVNLPGVGENMWDHLLFGPSYAVDLRMSAALNDPIARHEAVQEFYAGGGMLSNPGVDVFGFEKLPENYTTGFSNQTIADLATFPSDWPDFEYLFPAAVFGYCRNFIRDQPTDGRNYGSIIAAHLTPMSRGNVNIASDDTNDHPIIDPRWLTHPSDQEVVIQGFKRARAIWQSPSLSSVTVGDEYFPGSDVQTDEEILHLIREAMTPVSHAACTNKMGRADDPMAVVDTRARVYGTQGLRVVDASSFAILPPGHPMSTVYAYAEKIADDIKADNASS